MVRTEAIRNHQEPGIYLNSFRPATLTISLPLVVLLLSELTCPYQHPIVPSRAPFSAFSQGPQVSLERHQIHRLPAVQDGKEEGRGKQGLNPDIYDHFGVARDFKRV